MLLFHPYGYAFTFESAIIVSVTGISIDILTMNNVSSRVSLFLLSNDLLLLILSLRALLLPLTPLFWFVDTSCHADCTVFSVVMELLAKECAESRSLLIY